MVKDRNDSKPATLAKLEADMKAAGAVKLRDYCGWFDAFSREQRRAEELELPGQFDGDAGSGPPEAALHLRVSGFAEEAKVMQSKQMPKVLVVSRSDGTEARFLAKGGEDLRQDERIVRLFRLMQALLASDPACAARGLALRTYAVVPLSSRAGCAEAHRGRAHTARRDVRWLRAQRRQLMALRCCFLPSAGSWSGSTACGSTEKHASRRVRARRSRGRCA